MWHRTDMDDEHHVAGPEARRDLCQLLGHRFRAAADYKLVANEVGVGQVLVIDSRRPVEIRPDTRIVHVSRWCTPRVRDVPRLVEEVFDMLLIELLGVCVVL